MERDSWLSDVFGRDVFRVDAGPCASAPGFYYARVDTTSVDRMRELVEAGFRVVDVAVTLGRRSDGAWPEPRLPVVEALPAHHDELLRMAGSCFRVSRFHLDPAIPRETADRVKREWIRNYLRGRRGERLDVALVDGRPAGFLAVLAAPGTHTIDLIGVGDAFQRRGVGTALTANFIRRGGDRRLQVGTQAANLPSLRLYQRMGFEIERTAFVLHRHVP